MASVTKHPNSRFWTACYTDRDGVQRKRSTKSTERNQALEIALELERVERQSRSASLTTTQLRKVLNDVSERVVGDTIEVPSTETYLREWLAVTRPQIAASTFVRYESTVDQFLKCIGSKALQPITALGPQQIEQFLSARLADGRAPKTALVDVKTLNSAFRRAEAYGLILKNPVAAVRRPRDEASTRGIFTPEEVQQILDTAPNLEWQTAILLGYFVGARLSDCVRMQWENVHPELGVISYEQRKGRKKVIVPMHYHVIEHLNYLSGFGTKGLLCPTLAKRCSGGRNGLSGAFKRIIIRAGLDPGVIEGKGVRKFTIRTFHSLRHSFTSALANAGVSEEVRMKLTGHSSKPVHHIYTHLELATLRNAVTSLPLFTKKPPEGSTAPAKP